VKTYTNKTNNQWEPATQYCMPIKVCLHSTVMLFTL